MTADPRYRPGGDKGGQSWPRWMIVVVPLLVVVVVAGLYWALIVPEKSETVEPTATPSLVAEMLLQASPTAAIGDEGAVLPTEPTPEGLAEIEPSPTPAELVSNTPAPEEQGDNLYVEGDTVEVYGTEGSGLRMRMGAGTSYDRIKTLDDGAVLEIVGGPKEGDGFVWYQVRDQIGTTGWVVDAYIRYQTEVE